MLPRVEGSSTKPSTPAVDRSAAESRLSPSGKVAARLVRSLRPRRAPSCRASAAGEWLSACSNRTSMATTDGPAFATASTRLATVSRGHGHSATVSRLRESMSTTTTRGSVAGRSTNSRPRAARCPGRLDGAVEQALADGQERGDQHGGRHDAAERWRHRCQTDLNHLSFQRCVPGPRDRRTNGRMCGRSRRPPPGTRARG